MAEAKQAGGGQLEIDPGQSGVTGIGDAMSAARSHSAEGLGDGQRKENETRAMAESTTGSGEGAMTGRALIATVTVPILAAMIAMAVLIVAPLNSRLDSIDARFDSIDARFESMDARFESMDARFDSMDARLNSRFDSIDQRFTQIDQRFDSMDARLNSRFDSIDARFAQIDQRFIQIDQRFIQIDQRFVQIDEKFIRLEAKIDINAQRIVDIESKLDRIADMTILAHGNGAITSDELSTIWDAALNGDA